MPARGGLRRRLGRTFLLQAAFISVAAVVGVYIAGFAIEELLIKRALEGEADYYWRDWQVMGTKPLPDTRNLTGFMLDADGRGDVPDSLRPLSPGWHHLPTQADFSVVYVTERGGHRLFLIFDGERVGELALYFGLMPLMGALILVYVTTWLAYRASRRAVSPIIALAREVHSYDPTASQRVSFEPAEQPGGGDEEVQALADALTRLSQRVLDYVERERNFTRDASHELRTPLTVVRIAADLLLAEDQLSDSAKRSVHRIKRAAHDMEELTAAFLLLARESDQGMAAEPVSLNAVVADELDRSSLLLEGKPVEVRTVITHTVTVVASEKVLSVLVGNLIRNAFSYTDSGAVQIEVGDRQLVIEDSGIGIPAEQVKEVFEPFVQVSRSRRGGHGVGLTIVKRLSDRFGWPVSIQSEPGHGTRAVVDFPGANCRSVDDDCRA